MLFWLTSALSLSSVEKSFLRALESQEKGKTMDRLPFFNSTCTSLLLKNSDAENHLAFRITRRRLEMPADTFTVGNWHPLSLQKMDKVKLRKAGKSTLLRTHL